MNTTQAQKSAIVIYKDEECENFSVHITPSQKELANIVEVGMNNTFKKEVSQNYKLTENDILYTQLFITKIVGEPTADIFLDINKNIDLIFLGSGVFDIKEIDNIINFCEELFNNIYNY